MPCGSNIPYAFLGVVVMALIERFSDFEMYQRIESVSSRRRVRNRQHWFQYHSWFPSHLRWVSDAFSAFYLLFSPKRTFPYAFISLHCLARQRRNTSFLVSCSQRTFMAVSRPFTSLLCHGCVLLNFAPIIFSPASLAHQSSVANVSCMSTKIRKLPNSTRKICTSVRSRHASRCHWPVYSLYQLERMRFVLDQNCLVAVFSAPHVLQLPGK